MLKRTAFIILLTFALASLSFAQNASTNTNATRKRTATNANTQPAQNEGAPQTPARKPVGTAQTGNKQAGTAAKNPASNSVLDTFNELLDGIRAANAKVVTGIYWNSPQLVLFNYNGTVTKGWEQMRRNLESYYPDLKDVVLEVRDLHVTMLGRDAALITCQWTQSQTLRGTPETSSGRMTIVFRRVGGAWKAIHRQTSPDTPDATRVPPSEQTTPAPKP